MRLLGVGELELSRRCLEEFLKKEVSRSMSPMKMTMPQISDKEEFCCY
jgi:hypothetical protein